MAGLARVAAVLVVSAASIFTAQARAQTPACGPLVLAGTVPHEGKSLKVWSYSAKSGAKALIVAQDMRVNADGADRAYAVRGQHGLSYLCDGAIVGMNGGPRGKDTRICGSAVAEIDRLAIEGDRLLFPASMKHQICIVGFAAEGGKPCLAGGVLVGDGKEASAPIHRRARDAAGASMEHFESMTSLRHAKAVAGERNLSLDSAHVPFVVAPRSTPIPIVKGQFAYVVSDGKTAPGGGSPVARSVPAVVGDIGPANLFGEGSIALHQFLAYGGLRAGPPFDAAICPTGGAECTNLPYRPGVAFPYPYLDRKGGDVRPKANWPTPLLYVFLPSTGAARPDRYDVSPNAAGVAYGSGSIADGARDAAAPFGGIDEIGRCVRAAKIVPNFN